jgi:hypothetical protein
MAVIDLPANVSLADLLRAEAEAEDAEALTAEQLARLVDHDVKWVRARLGALIDDGQVEVVRVQRQRIDGQPYTAPAYRLTRP